MQGYIRNCYANKSSLRTGNHSPGKLAELNSLGINPYPAALYPVNATAASIKENYKGEENKAEFADVCLAGRIMSIRDMGKANFAVLQDASGKIQFYIKQDDICPGDDKSLFQHVWKNYSISAISLASKDLFSLPKQVKHPFMLRNLPF